MRKLISTLSCFFAIASTTVGANCILTDVHLNLGYRHDNTKWKREITDLAVIIEPDILSSVEFFNEVNFKKQDLFMVGLGVEVTDNCNFYIQAYGDYGWIYDGKVVDTFELKIPFSTSIPTLYGYRTSESITAEIEAATKLDGNHAYDLSVGIGYPFYFNCDQMLFIPLVGYAYNRQNLEVRKKAFMDENTESTARADSRICWYGPWIGALLKYSIDCYWNVFAQVDYHFTQASRRVSINNGPFQDLGICGYRDKTWGHQVTARVGTNYFFCDCWFVGADFNFNRSRAGGSHDRLTWRAIGFNGTLGYVF